MERDFLTQVIRVITTCPLRYDDPHEERRLRDKWDTLREKIEAAIPTMREAEHEGIQYEQVLTVLLDELAMSGNKLRGVTNLMRCPEGRASDIREANREQAVIMTMLSDIVETWDRCRGD